MRTAILIDGAFYCHRAVNTLGIVTPAERCNELEKYCYAHLRHISQKNHPTEDEYLYRIFYYDCQPLNLQVYHPFLKKHIDLSKTDTYKWTIDFIACLKRKRKFAIRLGRIAAKHDKTYYTIHPNIVKKLCQGKIKFEDLEENDFIINTEQKGVDIKIGSDIASMVFKKQIDRIVLISGDSDFVPAAKLARREGIDFILDPLLNYIPSDLEEHIDGLWTCEPFKMKSSTDLTH